MTLMFFIVLSLKTVDLISDIDKNIKSRVINNHMKKYRNKVIYGKNV